MLCQRWSVLGASDLSLSLSKLQRQSSLATNQNFLDNGKRYLIFKTLTRCCYIFTSNISFNYTEVVVVVVSLNRDSFLICGTNPLMDL